MTWKLKKESEKDRIMVTVPCVARRAITHTGEELISITEVINLAKEKFCLSIKDIQIVGF